MISRRSLLALSAPVFVIEAGREKEIVALFAPVPLGKELVPGWRLMNIRAQQTYIEVELVGPGRSAFVRLDHPDAAKQAKERTPSFAVTRGDNAEQGDGAVAATKLIELLKQNDRGTFWRTRATTPGGDPATPPQRSRGIVIPVVVTLAVGALALALFVRRRKAAS